MALMIALLGILVKNLPVGNDSHSGNAVPTTNSINDIKDKILQNKTGIILFLVRQNFFSKNRIIVVLYE